MDGPVGGGPQLRIQGRRQQGFEGFALGAVSGPLSAFGEETGAVCRAWDQGVGIESLLSSFWLQNDLVLRAWGLGLKAYSYGQPVGANWGRV